MSGIRNSYKMTTALPIASSAALVTTGLTSPITAGQTQRVIIRLHFSIGATGGIRAQIVVPAAGTVFVNSIMLINSVTPAVIPAEQVTSAVFTNALAVAGNHSLTMDATIVNGVNAGSIDFQIAQNTSDALALTALVGSWMEVIIY